MCNRQQLGYFPTTLCCGVIREMTCRDLNPCQIFSRVAPDWDLWRTLYQLIYSAEAKQHTTYWLRFRGCSSKTILFFFCSTSLPLAGTRWIESTNKLCSVHSLASVLSINFGSIKSYVTLRIKPGATGREARKLSSVLCAPPPTPAKPFFVHRSEKSWWPLIVFLRIERAQEKPDSLFSPQRGYFLRIYS